MFIHVIPNRKSRPAVLLRESRRDGSGKVRKHTLANLTDWPPGAVQALQDWLEKNRGGEGTPAEGKFAGFENAKECGNIKAIRLAMSRLGMAELLSSRPGRERSLALAKWKVGKFFEVSADKGRLAWRRLDEKIAEEARYDGLWVVRTSEPSDALPAEEAVRRYKELEKAERAFRTFKGYDLLVRPIHHRLDRRVRGHFFLCLLAQYVEWHMRKALAPMLFDDEGIEEVRRTRDPVGAAQHSEGAKKKRARASSPDAGAPVAWTTLLKELATLTRADVLLGDDPRLQTRIRRESIPTPRQAEALRLLSATSPWWPPTERGQ